MVEKTIKVSEEIYAFLDSLRKENETIESVLERLLPTKDTSVSIDDFFGKWIGSDEEFEKILGIINTAWNEWSNTILT